jgi:glucuronate isomerase
MKPFLDDDFLLDNRTASTLYHQIARDLPIFDFHTHVPALQIANDHRFANMTELWLAGDPHKRRAMRTNGVPEEQITGNASDFEKFEAWAATVPWTLGNPLYHWTHMELKRPFGVDGLLDGASAREIWQRCNERLSQAGFSARGLLCQFGVVAVCTTEDPTDSLEPHLEHARLGHPDVRLFPSWRPDRALLVEDPTTFNAWVHRLEAAAEASIDNYSSFLDALDQRHTAFHAAGCRLSDYGLDQAYSEDYTLAQVSAAFAELRSGKRLSSQQALRLKSATLYELLLLDHSRGWVQQLHLGALRDSNTRLLDRVGSDTGFDSMGDFEQARPLSRLLDRLDRTDQLSKTILCNNNPRDNALFATMMGNFQDGSVPGKMQLGSASWFSDQRDGIESQLGTLCNMGLLSRFVGVATDSRSFVSYSRHEYFRRILCNKLGREVEAGLLPDDRALLGKIVRGVCFENAAAYVPVGIENKGGD